MRGLDLPRGDERELVVDRDRVYELDGEDSRTLAVVGAFRVVHVNGVEVGMPHTTTLEMISTGPLVRKAGSTQRTKEMLVVLRALLDKLAKFLTETDAGRVFRALAGQAQHDADVAKRFRGEYLQCSDEQIGCLLRGPSNVAS